MINGLVLFIGKVGYVNIVIGLLSLGVLVVEVFIEIVIKLLKDMGGSFIKYFLMKGLVYKEEY